jgi:hypothetical protein
MPDVTFYAPTERGLEARIAEKLRALRACDENAGGKRPPPSDDE